MSSNKMVVDNIDVSGRDYAGQVFPQLEVIVKNIRVSVESTFREMIEEGAFDLYFPAEWGRSDGSGGPAQSGNIIYLTMEIDPGMDATVIAFDLFDLVRQSIDLHSSGPLNNQHVVRNEEGIKSLNKIRKAFTEAVKMIDESVL
jgi:hypothetical protein